MFKRSLKNFGKIYFKNRPNKKCIFIKFIANIYYVNIWIDSVFVNGTLLRHASNLNHKECMTGNGESLRCMAFKCDGSKDFFLIQWNI